MHIEKKFNDYCDKFFEALNSPQKISWIEENDSLIGKFTVDNSLFRIECLKYVGNNYSYNFSFYSSESNKWIYDLTNSKNTNKLVVLSTVISGLDYLYNKFKPNSITFSATDSSKARKRLYTEYCMKFSKIINYKFMSKGFDEREIYFISKPNLTTQEQNDIDLTAQQMIEEKGN